MKAVAMIYREIFFMRFIQKIKYILHMVKAGLRAGKAKLSNNFEQIWNRALKKHPIACCFAIFIGVPIAMIVALAVASFAVMLPLSLICGWI